MPLSHGAELGESNFTIKYNKNGRPVRKSAGQRVSPNLGYVDSSTLDQQLLELTPEDLTESSSDFDSEAERERERQKKKTKKRKRTPSPTPPPLSPLPPPDLLSVDGETPPPFSLDSDDEAVPLQSIEPIHLTFNIEKGFSGPLHVQLDLGALMGSRGPIQASSRAHAAYPTKKRKVESLPLDSHKKSFLSLPPGKCRIYSEHDFLRTNNAQNCGMKCINWCLKQKRRLTSSKPQTCVARLLFCEHASRSTPKAVHSCMAATRSTLVATRRCDVLSGFRNAKRLAIKM